MYYKELSQNKKVKVLVFGSIITMKVNKVAATKLVNDEWVDVTAFELTGNWNGRFIKSDLIHNQKSFKNLQETIMILTR